MNDFVKDTNVPINDLISRQAAIKDYQRVCAIVTCGDCPFHIVDGAFTDCRLERWLKALPSAEPEIIMCKDCSHWKKLITDVHRCSVLKLLTNPEDFCSFCAKERKNNER